MSGACPAAEQQTERGSSACLHPFLVIVAIVLGIVGVVVKGLLCLLFIGIVVSLSDFSSALWGLGDGAAAPGNPSPGFDTSGHSAAPKCSNLGTRVDESNEYQAYRSR